MTNFNGENFVVVNKAFARKYGFNTSIVLGELCYRADKNNGKKFVLTFPELEYHIGLSPYQLRCAFAILSDLEILTVTREGLPCKNWYEVHVAAVEKVLKSLKEGE